MDQGREEALLALVREKTPSERQAFLEGACLDDPELRQRIEARLLEMEKASVTATTEGMDSKTHDHPATLSEGKGTVIGRYKLLEKLGEGGNGEVWAAEQRRPVKRRVAVKIIKLGMDTKQVIARFEAERQALALMDHPHIAKVFDAGATETGRPYFVMELVRGIPFSDYCDQEKLPTQQRLDLFIKVCHAIQHAHQKGIIHRDIKPSNILVTLHDGQPVPKVIDFGIAKATQLDLTERTVYTQFQQFIGTPAYMSPEQAEMSGLDIDTRSDIYSLGVLLYELLTGSTPFDTRELMKSGLDQMRKIIREREPYRPSNRIGTLSDTDRTTTARRQSTDPPKLISVLRGDLDWIVMKCLEKDRIRRYETANGLAMDLKRHLGNEPVLARPPSSAYRLHKAWERNKTMFGAVSAVAAALLLGTAVSLWQTSVATSARYAAVLSEQEKERQRNAAEMARTGEATQRRRAEIREGQARRIAYIADMNLANRATTDFNRGRAIRLLERHRPDTGQPDLRDWEWRYLWQQCQSDVSFEYPQQENAVFSLDISSDGRLAVTMDLRGHLTLWNRVTRNEIATAQFGPQGYRSLAFSPDDRLIALGCRSDQGMPLLKLIETGSLATLHAFPHKSQISFVTFMGDSGRVITLTFGGKVTLWDRTAEAPIWTRQFETKNRTDAHAGVLTVDSRGLLVAVDRGLYRLDSQEGHTVWEASGSLSLPVMALAASPDGSKIALGTGFVDGTIHLYDGITGKHQGALVGHRAFVSNLAFLPDGNRLVSASGDQTIRIWDVAASRTTQVLQGHTNEVYSLGMTPDGKRLISGDKNGSIYEWDLSRKKRRSGAFTLPGSPLLQVESIAYDLRRKETAAFQPDGRALYLIHGGSVYVWDTLDLSKKSKVESAGGDVEQILLSPDGDQLVAIATSGDMHVIDTATRFLSVKVENDGVPIVTGTFSEGGESLTVIDTRGRLVTWHTANWQTEIEADLNDSRSSPPVSHASKVWLDPAKDFAIYSLDRELVWWDFSAHCEVTRIEIGRNRIWDFALSPDGALLAEVDTGATGRLLDARTRQLVGEDLRGHLLGVHGITFSHDGRRIATGSNSEDAVKLWDVETRQEALNLAGEGQVFWHVSFSPDDRFLLAINDTGLAHMWHAPSWTEIASVEALQGIEASSR